jgi:hypothetical protein
MNMSVVLKAERFVPHRYPWIGICNSLIVLFSAHDMGTLLAGEAHIFNVGDYGEWDMSAFEFFDGAVTLSNHTLDVVVIEGEDE